MNGLPLVPYKNVGDDVTTDDWNRIARICNSLSSVVGVSPVNIRQLNNSLIIGVSETSFVVAFRMRVKSISNDYLTCHGWDGTNEGTRDILVAKPAQLRHTYTLYAGLTSLTTTDAQTVSATDGSTTEVWKVTPDYIVDGDIYATPSPTGKTGVTVSGDELAWLDLNISGRAWAVYES